MPSFLSCLLLPFHISFIDFYVDQSTLLPEIAWAERRKTDEGGGVALEAVFATQPLNRRPGRQGEGAGRGRKGKTSVVDVFFFWGGGRSM